MLVYAKSTNFLAAQHSWECLADYCEKVHIIIFEEGEKRWRNYIVLTGDVAHYTFMGVANILTTLIMNNLILKKKLMILLDTIFHFVSIVDSGGIMY